MGKEQILATIRQSLAGRREWLAAEAERVSRDAPAAVMPPADDLVAQFAAELGKLEGKTYLVHDDEEALETLAGLLDQRGAQALLAWDLEQIDLVGLPALLAERGTDILETNVRGAPRKELLQTLEPVPVCLSGAEVVIAESGTLLLRHGPGRPRLASLLAPAHIAVVRADQFVRGFGDALRLLQTRYGTAIFEDTSNLTLVTGPSRTADIEMTLSLGIHGPPEVHVIVIRSPNAQ
jgi:L-lactate dehydrogenase complex protein LldG